MNKKYTHFFLPLIFYSSLLKLNPGSHTCKPCETKVKDLTIKIDELKREIEGHKKEIGENIKKYLELIKNESSWEDTINTLKSKCSEMIKEITKKGGF